MTRAILPVLAALALAVGGRPAVAGNYGFPTTWTPAPPCTAKNAAARKPLCRPVDLSGYVGAFDDEFDALRVTKDGGVGPWYAGVHANENAGSLMAPAGDAAYAISGGVLTLTTRYDGARYVETNLQTADSRGHLLAWRNFYAEVRLRGPQLAASHAGVWFLSPETGRADASGGHTEFDLVEQYGPGDQYDHSSTHVWPGARKDIAHVFASTTTARPEGKANGWHVYGLLATDDAFTVYRDGKAIQQVTRLPAQRVPLYVLLSLFGNTAQGPASADTMLVDYVRVYTPR